MSAVSVIKNKANTGKVRSEISITAITTTISSHSFIHLPILPYLLAVIADTAVATAHIIVAWLDRATLPSTLSFSLPLLVTFTALSILSLQLRQQQCRLVNTPSDQESSHITHTHTHVQVQCKQFNTSLTDKLLSTAYSVQYYHYQHNLAVKVRHWRRCKTADADDDLFEEIICRGREKSKKVSVAGWRIRVRDSVDWN